MGRGTLLVFVLALAAPGISLASQSSYMGHVHSSLGQATLLFAGDSLTIGNLGSSGNDGVSIALGPTASFELQMAPVHVAGSGSFMTACIASGDTISSARLSEASGSVELEVAFKDIPGITHYHVDAYLNGALVRSRDLPLAVPIDGDALVLDNDICIRCFFRKVVKWVEDNASTHSKTVYVPSASDPTQYVPVTVYGVDFPLGIVAHGQITDDSVPISFDNLEVRPVGATSGTGILTQVNITGANLAPLVFRSESITTPMPLGTPTKWMAIALVMIGAGVAYLMKQKAETSLV